VRHCPWRDQSRLHLAGRRKDTEAVLPPVSQDIAINPSFANTIEAYRVSSELLPPHTDRPFALRERDGLCIACPD
jgi:hypothetical protein